LAGRHGIDPKSVSKWKKRPSAGDLPPGPKQAHSSVPPADGGRPVFRRHDPPPLGDCSSALHNRRVLIRGGLHRTAARGGMGFKSNKKTERKLGFSMLLGIMVIESKKCILYELYNLLIFNEFCEQIIGWYSGMESEDRMD
jgi:hypothetical protein